MVLRDYFWLWGHPEGRYNDLYGNTKVSRMTPLECCMYLGIRNTFMVPVGWNINKRQYNKSFKPLRHVGWECFKAARDITLLDPIIEDAAEFKNINCVVFDDFNWHRDKNGEVDTEQLWKIRERLHNNETRPLEMWMVLYTHEYGLNPEKDERFKKFVEPFDGIIMWTWKECDVPLIPEKFEILKKLAVNQRFMAGCYLWNFGEEKEATGEAVKWQLDWYREKMFAKELEGVVLHTNTMADLDYEAYDVAIEWMDAHGDEPFEL